MRYPQTTTQLFALLAFLSVGALVTPAQTNQARSMVTQPVNESQMVMRSGSTHPLARAEFDRGLAPDSLPMDNMMLGLKRTPEQDAALATLLREQQDPSSANYHKWISPQEFGARFGPSDHDVQAVTSWLQSHGFQGVEVSPSRTVIHFSGTAGQVHDAFRTAIHRYVVNGEEHWANSTEQQIPAALANVVAGVGTLHNFAPKRASHSRGTFTRTADGKVKPLHPLFTFPVQGDCGFVASNCFALGPEDFAIIYNVLPLWNAGIDGTGQTIAVVGDSNLNMQDVVNFRKMFGLPAKNPVITIPTGSTDPGITPDEIESDLDVQWAGAIAKNATINFVIAANTNSTAGVDAAAQFIVDNKLAPVLSESFGDCEQDLGTVVNGMVNTRWMQGATEGITIVVSTGDNGSAACDFDDPNVSTEQPAVGGLAVSGLASTPFNVAVGGTDFNQLTNATSFWSTNSLTSSQGSALGYIPETTWNDSCTNALFGQVGFSTTPEANCNNTANLASSIGPIGGSGGISTCAVLTGSPPKCSSGNPRPTWQTGPGVPGGSTRLIPDVSFFAGDGLVGSFYIICQQDTNTNNTPCSLGSDKNGNSFFEGVGGTSVSTQVMGAIFSLLVQKTGGNLGLPNPTLYSLAAQQNAAACNSASPASSCIFNDVTVGTISAPCVKGTPNCNVATQGDANGILTGFSAGTAYDLATGLGSVNVCNLANNFAITNPGAAADFALSNCVAIVSVPSAGGSGTLNLTVTAINGFTGTFNFTSSSCTGLPTGASCSFNPASVTLDSTHQSASTVVTITTTASVPPSIGAPPNGNARWFVAAATTLATIVGMAFLLFGGKLKQLRWNISVAAGLMALAFVLGIAGCSGGSSGGGGGGGGTGTGTSTNAMITATSNATTHSMTFTVNVF
jgi:subtilase family serine protease